VLDTTDLRTRVEAMRWHHKIDLPGGVVTPGLANRLPVLEASLPDLTGRSVLDIGAWDGYYSFLAERRGASRVVALDHYVWGVDMPARNVYWAECRARGELPDHGRDETEFWRDDLPGRRPFELARDVLQSRVEAEVGDFMTVDLAALGSFDVVLYLGVLYHMPEPLTALQRLHRITRSVAVIETEAIVVPDHSGAPLLSFFAGDELGADYGNWYVPTETALHAMCRAAGFARVETKMGPPVPPPAPPPPGLLRGRHRPPAPPPEAIAHYRLAVHAFV